jgi:hypothetical protein
MGADGAISASKPGQALAMYVLVVALRCAAGACGADDAPAAAAANVARAAPPRVETRHHVPQLRGGLGSNLGLNGIIGASD